MKELQKLRSIFQKYDFFSVVASTPMIFPGISEHDEPFYNFFQIQYLSEFSLEEIKHLIQKIAEAENNKKFLDDFKKYEPKIHGMSHLTGGSPRLVILFYEMITKGELENIENAFFKIIDEHTPYYQEIFQLLTGQRRKIFDAVISSEAPITPKQISEVTRLDLPTVTTQLRRLETDGYVISRPMGRSTKYEVRERLFRLWREMRQPLGRKRVSILLEFLQYWYTPEERKELFKIKFELLEAGEKKVLKDLCYVTETLSPEFKTEARLKLTPKLIEFGEREEAAYEILKLKETATQIKDRELDGKIPLHEGNLFISEKRYEEALEAFNKAIEINPKDGYVFSRKGVALGIMGRYEEALEAFNKAIEVNPRDGYALSRKGFALINLGRNEKSLDIFDQAIEINPKDGHILSSKGIALGNLGRHDEALDLFNKAIEINPQDNLIENIIEVCFNFALNELKAGNQGNAAKFIKVLYDFSAKLKEDKVAMLTINFLKSAVDSGDLQIVKVAVDEIIKLYGKKYEDRIKLIIKAIEIVETKDIQKYYNLQIEEREIVGDIVKKITKSDELLPEEIKRKESRLTDFTDT